MKGHMVNVRVTEKQYSDLRASAEKSGRSLSGESQAQVAESFWIERLLGGPERVLRLRKLMDDSSDAVSG